MSMHESKSPIRIAMLGLALVFTAPRDAAAQSPDSGPDEAACQGKQSGDACTLVNGTAGACGPATCSRLDYSQGSPPKATEEPCTACMAGAASHDPPPLGETSETSGASSTAAEPSSGGGEVKPSEDVPPQSSSRCSVTDRSGPNDLGWLCLLVLPVVSRRRTRRSR
jgi:hypothetical protein